MKKKRSRRRFGTSAVLLTPETTRSKSPPKKRRYRPRSRRRASEVPLPEPRKWGLVGRVPQAVVLVPGPGALSANEQPWRPILEEPPVRTALVSLVVAVLLRVTQSILPPRQEPVGSNGRRRRQIIDAPPVRAARISLVVAVLFRITQGVLPSPLDPTAAVIVAFSATWALVMSMNILKKRHHKVGTNGT